MIRILLLHPDRDPTGGWKQFVLARPHLPDRFVFATEPVRPGPWGFTTLRDALVRETPDVLHTFGATAFRAARVLQTFGPARPRFPKWIASGAAGCGARWSRPLTPPVDAAVAFSAREAELLTERLMVGCIHLLDPAVVTQEPAAAAPELPTKYVLAAGGFDATADLKAAVWAFEMMKYADPDLHLVILGDGPRRRELERFARGLAWDDYRIHFAGWKDDVTPYLTTAAVVWVTHAGGGKKFALEAMAAGRPLVAVRTEDTAAVIDPDETGLLVPPGDKVALAAITRKLLTDSARADRLGYAARTQLSGYTADVLANAMASAYDRLSRTTV